MTKEIKSDMFYKQSVPNAELAKNLFQPALTIANYGGFGVNKLWLIRTGIPLVSVHRKGVLLL